MGARFFEGDPNIDKQRCWDLFNRPKNSINVTTHGRVCRREEKRRISWYKEAPRR
jgi:hypothetical protein